MLSAHGVWQLLQNWFFLTRSTHNHPWQCGPLQQTYCLGAMAKRKAPLAVAVSPKAVCSLQARRVGPSGVYTQALEPTYYIILHYITLPVYTTLHTYIHTCIHTYIPAYLPTYVHTYARRFKTHLEICETKLSFRGTFAVSFAMRSATCFLVGSQSFSQCCLTYRSALLGLLPERLSLHGPDAKDGTRLKRPRHLRRYVFLSLRLKADLSRPQS